MPAPVRAGGPLGPVPQQFAGIVPATSTDTVDVPDDFFADETTGTIHDAPVSRRTLVRTAGPALAEVCDWDQLSASEDGYILRHDGKLYAAVEIDTDALVKQAFHRQVIAVPANTTLLQ